jgi:hypothetical protein
MKLKQPSAGFIVYIFTAGCMRAISSSLLDLLQLAKRHATTHSFQTSFQLQPKFICRTTNKLSKFIKNNQ